MRSDFQIHYELHCPDGPIADMLFPTEKYALFLGNGLIREMPHIGAITIHRVKITRVFESIEVRSINGFHVNGSCTS